MGKIHDRMASESSRERLEAHAGRRFDRRCLYCGEKRSKNIHQTELVSFSCSSFCRRNRTEIDLDQTHGKWRCDHGARMVARPEIDSGRYEKQPSDRFAEKDSSISGIIAYAHAARQKTGHVR